MTAGVSQSTSGQLLNAALWLVGGNASCSQLVCGFLQCYLDFFFFWASTSPFFFIFSCWLIIILVLSCANTFHYQKATCIVRHKRSIKVLMRNIHKSCYSFDLNAALPWVQPSWCLLKLSSLLLSVSVDEGFNRRSHCLSFHQNPLQDALMLVGGLGAEEGRVYTPSPYGFN